MNSGLPYRWEKGDVHILAWEVVEDDWPSKFTHILVLKKFDQPTEKGGHNWCLARLRHTPADDKWPWQARLIVPPPPLPGERMPQLSDAFLSGHELTKDPPTDEQIKTFLTESDFTPPQKPVETSGLGGTRLVTTKVTAGGLDRRTWKQLLGHDVPTDLFPELKKPDR